MFINTLGNLIVEEMGLEPTTSWLPVFTSGNVKLYVNGEFISEKNFTQGSANNESFRIGRHNSCDLQWFKGKIDKVLLFT